MKDTKYQCELTELQLQIIQDALDFLFRMRMGQIQEIHQIRPKGPRIPDELMGQLKVELFPELGSRKRPRSCCGSNGWTGFSNARSSRRGC